MKILKTLAAIFALLVIGGLLVGRDDEIVTEKATKTQPAPEPRPSVSCDYGTPVAGRFFVKGREINFRAGPGTNHKRVINQKATQVLGKTQYRTLWPSMVLEGRCETEEWLQAKIVEVDGGPVNWETGWAHKMFVAGTASTDIQAGLVWDIEREKDFTVEEKELLRRGALKVLSDEPNCAKIIDGYRSGSRKGAYYVTCVSKKDGGAFNVWFTPGDVETGSKLGVPKAYPEEPSRRGCENAIEARVTHPSTLDIHRFMGYATQVHNNGNRTVIQEFTAKNSFGLETKHRARCLVLPDGSLEITITEVR